jgi:hypothetical protein
MIPESLTGLDRLWSAFRALVRAELPTLSFLGVYEYRVTATDGTASTPATTVDCTPTDPALKLPSLSKVPVRLPYGVTPPVGALCAVQFMNGDPSKPTVTNFADPMTLMVFAGGTLPNARQGDMVAVAIANPASASLNVTMAALALQFVSPAGPCTWTPAGPPLTLYGLVSSGRPTVKS